MISRKVIQVFVILFVALAMLGATESRIKALTGSSEEGALLVSDSWCDPFYISPSLAALYSDTFFWVKDSVDFIYSFGNGDYVDSFGKMDRSHRAGLFYSKNNFRFLFDFEFSNLFAQQRSWPNSYTPERSDYSIFFNETSLFLGGNLLFAWHLSDNLSFGVKVGAESTVYEQKSYVESWKERDYFSSPGFDLGHRSSGYDTNSIFNLTIRENIGLTVDKEKFTTTFALPFVFLIDDNQGSSQGSNLFSRATDYKFDTAFRSLTDFKPKESLLIRLNAEFNLSGLSRKTSLDSRKYSLLTEGTEAWTGQALLIGGKISWTMNHYFKSEKHLLFYGAKFNTFHVLEQFSNKQYGNYTTQSLGLRYFALDGYFGGEMKPHERVHILFGLNFELFRAVADSYSKEYSLGWKVITEGVRDELYSAEARHHSGFWNLYSPMSCDINFGVEINPVKGFTIELNTSLFNLSPDSVTSSLIFNFDIGLVWNISQLKRNSELK